MMPRNYFAYLMRIWRSEDPLQGGWFASLEEPSTHRIIHFNTLDELFEFLRKQSGTCESETIPSDEVSQGYQRL